MRSRFSPFGASHAMVGWFLRDYLIRADAPCRANAAGDFLLRTSGTRASNLRSGRGHSNLAVWLTARNRALSRRMRILRGTPVLAKLTAGCLLLLLLGSLLAIVASSVGPYTVPFSNVAGILLERVGIGDSSASDTETAIVTQIRVPRILLSLVVGAALGVSGAVMQGLFRNPMADPGIIGVSTGGALGAVIAIATGLQLVFVLALPAMSFAGAAGALVLVYAVASLGGRFSMATLLLTGIALSAFMAAIISAIVLFTSDLQAQREMLFWLAGGLGSSTWSDVRISLPIIVLGVGVAVVFSRDLNLMMVSEEEARALGVRVGLTRNTLLLIASLITGTAVAFSGAIAFVGLIAPHTLRLIVGADHRVLVPLSALGGGVFMLCADTLARTVISPVEIPVGVVTALVGAPFFVLLLARNRARASML